MRCFLPVLLLSACASASPAMMGSARHDVSVGGMDFVVFRKGDQVEIVRLGYLSRAQRDRVPGLMIKAGEQATGCRVSRDSMSTRLPGDTGVATFDLAC